MSAEPTSPVAPSQHEACAVQERVAIGTAGVVYRAVQESTKRVVTFKVLTTKSSHPFEPSRVLALRWRLEALQHPVIATLIDAYQDPEGFVIVTSWMPGAMGANEFPIKQRTLTKQEARLVAMRLCGALLIGEQQRFPHGDLKPSNIVLADRGQQGMELQIQDWGLSACREEQPPETLQFMAPERHHGHPASPQGDLFTAAASLWFLLTGECPAYGSTKEQVLADWGAFNPATLAEKRPDLDEHFRQWIAWLLRWQPGDRPETVNQALDVLNEVVGYAAAVEGQASQPPANSSAPSNPAPSPASPPAPAPSTASPKPIAPRAAVGQKLQLPVASAAPPAPSEVTPRPARPKPPKEPVNKGQRVMAAIMVLCLLAGIGIAFVAWAENRYGPDWKPQFAANFRRVFASNSSPSPAPAVVAAATTASSLSSSSKKSSGSTTKTSGSTSAASAKQPNASSSKNNPPKSNPSTNTSKAPAAPKPLAADKFDGGGDLQGRGHGAGWKGPWQATSVIVEGDVALLGKGSPSTASRPLGTIKNLSDDYLNVTLLVNHPGKDAPPLKVDILSPDGKALTAPACVSYEDGKLHVFIEGGSEKLEVPAGKPFRLALRYDWKKKSGSKRVVNVSAVINPSADSNKVAAMPNSKRTLVDHTLPASFLLLLQTDAANLPVSITDLRIARAIRDALP
jgi:serine/threonine protein kinase